MRGGPNPIALAAVRKVQKIELAAAILTFVLAPECGRIGRVDSPDLTRPYFLAHPTSSRGWRRRQTV